MFQHVTGQAAHYSMAEFIYWLRATISPALQASVGVVIGNRGIEVCISLSSS